jgi:hypothetical protein
MVLIVAALHDDTAKYERRSTADEINMAQQARVQSTLVWLAKTSGRPFETRLFYIDNPMGLSDSHEQDKHLP